MSKLIIWVSGRPALDGFTKREFKWSEEHKKFIFEGREILDTEFNTVFERAFRTNDDLLPRVMVVEAAAAPAPRSPEPTAPVPPPQPRPREISVDEAEGILMRLAPDRLRKKAGPKPRTIEVG